MARSRGWCFTINNYTQQDFTDCWNAKCTYLTYGREVGAEGTPHLQGYIYCKNVVARTAVSKMLPRAAIFKQKGTCDQAINYCHEDDLIPFSKGKRPMSQKEKGDTQANRWKRTRQLAREGNEDDIDDELYLRYYSTIKKIKVEHAPKPATLDNTVGHWYVGPSGAGKSKKAREENPGAYLKGNNKWWDGYGGEDVVIVEDMDPTNINLAGHVKRWNDHYPFTCECKGGTMVIRPKKIIYTSQYEIDEVFGMGKDAEAIARRCERTEFEKE